MTEETRVLHRRRLDNGLVTYLAQIGGGIEIQGLEQDRVVIVRMFAKTSSFICWNYRMSRPVYSSSFFSITKYSNNSSGTLSRIEIEKELHSKINIK